MVTKDIVEAILYMNSNSYKYLKAIHVINNTDRNWTAREHKEYPFIKAFSNSIQFFSN